MASLKPRPPGTPRPPLDVFSCRAAAVRLSAAAAALSFLAQAVFAQGRAEVVIRPAPRRVPSLAAWEQKQVDKAVERGVSYLRRTQQPSGSWIGLSKQSGRAGPSSPLQYETAGLGGLALLESGVAAGDPAVKAAARLIRESGPGLSQTYEVALALLFLDRLGDARDRPLIRSLALRLVKGQTALGGWSYGCPPLEPAQEEELEKALRKKARADLPRWLQPPPLSGEAPVSDRADNSNTQFAVLALGAARRHGLPLDYPLRLAELRFRESESAAGWTYRYEGRPGGSRPDGYGSMTCAGLLGLAVGRATAEDKGAREGKPGQGRPQDPGIAWGLHVLSAYLRSPSDVGIGNGGRGFGPRGALNLYFLWSVERVGVLCGVDTIGGVDWYRWGAGLLLRSQRRDGSWLGRGSGGYPTVDTSFALLFLSRSDLLPDLRQELAKRVQVVDPGRAVNGGLMPKGGKGPAMPDLKGFVAAGEAPLAADLGAVPAGQAVERPLRVRGPEAFRITGVRGGDQRLKVRADSLPAKVHDLTVTLHLDKAGPVERTLYLQTDLPGRAEVAVRIRARATASPNTGP